MKKFKILQINKFHFIKGGSERHVFDLSKKLKEAGHIVIHFSMEDSRNVVNADTSKKYFIKNIDFKFSIKNIVKLFYNYDAVKKIKKIIKEEKPDIVHLHNFAHHFSPVILSVIKKHHIPMVQTLHDYKLICPNYKLFSQGETCMRCKGGKYYNCTIRKCMKDSYLKSLLATVEAYYTKFFKFYSKIDFFIAPSEYMKDRILEFGYPESKVRTIYNFIDVENKKNKKFGNGEINTKDEENFIFYFGRLSDEKGVCFLIEALQKVKNEKLKLKIAGNGPSLEKLRKKVEKLKLGERVEFLGFLDKKEVNSYIDKAKAMVMPSIWPENMPYSLLEAMARAKIVIASRVGGMPELIDGESGMTFKSEDLDDLVKKIEDLDFIDREKMQRKARERVMQLSSNNYLDKLEEIYYSL